MCQKSINGSTHLHNTTLQSLAFGMSFGHCWFIILPKSHRLFLMLTAISISPNDALLVWALEAMCLLFFCVGVFVLSFRMARLQLSDTIRCMKTCQPNDVACVLDPTHSVSHTFISLPTFREFTRPEGRYKFSVKTGDEKVIQIQFHYFLKEELTLCDFSYFPFPFSPRDRWEDQCFRELLIFSSNNCHEIIPKMVNGKRTVLI